MTLTAGIRAGIKLAGKIDRKYNINKIFIDKYVPPHMRKPARQLVDILGTTGGAYGVYKALYAPDTPGNDNAQIPFKKQPQTSPPYKTRGRQSTGFYGRNRQQCYPDRYRRRSRFSKRR